MGERPVLLCLACGTGAGPLPTGPMSPSKDKADARLPRAGGAVNRASPPHPSRRTARPNADSERAKPHRLVPSRGGQRPRASARRGIPSGETCAKLGGAAPMALAMSVAVPLVEYWRNCGRRWYKRKRRPGAKRAARVKRMVLAFHGRTPPCGRRWKVLVSWLQFARLPGAGLQGTPINHGRASRVKTQRRNQGLRPMASLARRVARGQIAYGGVVGKRGLVRRQ